MSEIVHDSAAPQDDPRKMKELPKIEPIKRNRIGLGQVIVIFGALLLILAVVLPALLAPAMGSIFSNVVSTL